MKEDSKSKVGEESNSVNNKIEDVPPDSSSEIKNKNGAITTKIKSSKVRIRSAGEKIRHTLKIYKLKKKLAWIKNHVSEMGDRSQAVQIGPEEKKLQILLKELDMLKRFNMLGFDSDAINLLLGLYYMLEIINEEGKMAHFLANGTVPEEKKAASLESLLHEWWEKVELLPSYKERTAEKYQHLGTRVVIEKLYSKRKFVDPLNNIINEINEYIKKRDMDGVIKAVKKAEIFCEDLKRMAARPERREYSRPIRLDEPGKGKKSKPGMKKFIEEKIKNLNRIEKIRGEASTRTFFRLFFERYTLVAMVFPQENREEIERIVRLTRLYGENNILVPGIKEVIDNRIILQEDAGDTLLQKGFSGTGKEQKKGLLQKTVDILSKLRGISPGHTDARLGHDRMKWEMDFFLQHFVGNFYPEAGKTDILREKLYALVKKIKNITCFAHRDFHSRNILCHKGELYVVDFQDSLVASPYYDLVSFAFDSYLDLKTLREFLFREFEKRGHLLDYEQLHLTALQRNIKALGTFGYQVFVRKNLAYKKYINRTL
ncbi:MAG: phosphotransferase, partial [Candidatus Aminicenantes bacterium]|nr:phosphotransferase [Candidatus Aminicenantes bacterium]